MILGIINFNYYNFNSIIINSAELQGETTENMEKTLICILNTGNCVFHADDTASSVHLKLVYDPYFVDRRRGDSDPLGVLLLHGIVV